MILGRAVRGISRPEPRSSRPAASPSATMTCLLLLLHFESESHFPGKMRSAITNLALF